MDTLYWKRLSESIQISNTTKQFYSKYLYKMVLNAPGCKSIADIDIASSLSQRIMHSRTVNYGGSWYGSRDTRYAKEADLAWLELLQKLKLSNADIKVRCEEPKVQIYTANEDDLKQVVNYIKEYTTHILEKEYTTHILEIYGPENEQARKLLEENKTIVSKQTKYRWKVSFAEKRCDHALRKNILNYLQQLDDLVKIPKSTVEQFSRPNDWIWGCYIYTNDLGITDMLRIIYPDLIREVSEMVQLDNK